MKKSILMALVILAILLTVPRDAFAARENHTYTITSGTPIHLATQDLWVKRVFIQAAVGGSGYVCIMAGIQTSGYTPSCSNSSDLTAQLAPATSTAPGGSYSDPNGAPGGETVPDVNLAGIFIDGSHTGDGVVVSFEF